MATTRPTAQPKEKSSSVSSAPPKRRTASRPSTPDDKEPAHYLRSTASSRTPNDVPRTTGRPTLAAAGKRVISSNIANRPANKSPSPSRQPHRATPPSTVKERPAKTPSPAARTAVVPKPGADKSSKITALKSGRTSPITRARSFGAGTNAPKKKEAHATSLLTTTIASTNPDAAEEKEEPAVEVAPEEVKPVEDEPKLVDVVPQTEDHVDDHELTEPPEPKVLAESEPATEPEATESPRAPEQEKEAAIEVAPEEEKKDETQEESLVMEAPAEPTVEATEEVETEKVSAVPALAAEAKEEKAEAPVPAPQEEEKAEVPATQEEENNPAPAPAPAPATIRKTEVVGRRKEAAPAGNAVIEEKMGAARRKNKVLALVGAFETVISLQEPEPSPKPQLVKQEEDNNHKAVKEAAESTT